MDFWTKGSRIYTPTSADDVVIDPAQRETALIEPVTLGSDLDEEFSILAQELDDGGGSKCCRGR